MKEIYKLPTLVLGTLALSSILSAQTEILKDLVQKQETQRWAIGWVDAGRIEFIMFSNKPSIQYDALQGPVLWAASLGGRSGQEFGETEGHGKHTFLALKDGQVLWENSDLVPHSVPEVSSGGDLLLFNGHDRKSGSNGLLLVRNNGQDVSEISRDGQNPTWSPDETEFAYDDNGEIVIYDLRDHQQQVFGVGTSPTWSPDGRWICYRTSKNQIAVADVTTHALRVLLDGKLSLTPLYWSPDSEYLMYVEQPGRNGTLQCPNATNVMVYRLKDGVQVPVYRTCAGYPYWMLRWIRLPPKVRLGQKPG